MTGRQGWDVAEFRCGRCGTHLSAQDEAEYVRLITEHQATHSSGEQLLLALAEEPVQ